MKEKETCQDLLQRPDYVKHRDLLVGYSKGEVSLDAVMPERCDVGAAPP